MKDVTGNDKAFYDDQKSTRVCCLSEENDEDFEKEKEKQLLKERELQQHKIETQSFIVGNNNKWESINQFQRDKSVQKECI